MLIPHFVKCYWDTIHMPFSLPISSVQFCGGCFVVGLLCFFGIFKDTCSYHHNFLTFSSPGKVALNPPVTQPDSSKMFSRTRRTTLGIGFSWAHWMYVLLASASTVSLAVVLRVSSVSCNWPQGQSPYEASQCWVDPGRALSPQAPESRRSQRLQPTGPRSLTILPTSQGLLFT